ncbi:hypothetical protein L596_002578 [Steinernema carpocapsae]|uniref:Rootletin-like coiled-coil domain-containing protein n=1 Tax=Steinernema carpocapsae TaxID=34508 RepID=A0A4V6I7Q0_STECR|nr:hypothetical protein L596_002578 [Steinernema carpocapsae]
MTEASAKEYDHDIVEIPLSTSTGNLILSSLFDPFLAELNRVPNDLSSYRHRIDANVEEQRKYREVLEGLQDKVLKYRQKAAESDICLGTSISDRHSASLSSYHGSNQFTSPDHQAGSGAGLLHVVTDANVSPLDFPLLQPFDATLEEVIDMLRSQSEAAAEANYYLKEDLIRLQEALGVAQQEVHFERESAIKMRKKSRQKFEGQCKSLLDLWMVCNKLKKQVNERSQDLKFESEADLDRQKTEFIRCANNMERLFRETHIREKMNTTKSSSEIQETIEEVMKKYDEIVLQNVKIDHEKSDVERKLLNFENTIKRLENERDQAISLIKKIQQMPEMAESSGRRARSVSPVRFTASHETTVCQVRRVLKDQKEEIKSWKKLNDEAEERVKELESQLRLNDRNKQNSERLVQEHLRTIEELKRECDESTRNLHRQADCVQRLEEEKNELRSTIQVQLDQLSELKSFHQKTIDDLSQVHREEWEKQKNRMDAEYEEKERITESRLERLKKDIEVTREDLRKSRQEENNLKIELIAGKRQIENYERETVEASRRLQLAREQLDQLQSNLQEKEVFLVDLEKQLDESRSELQISQESREELQAEKTVLVKENAGYIEEITELRGELMQHGIQLESHQTQEEEHRSSLKFYKEQITRHETIIEEHKIASSELEHQLEIAHTECEALKKELGECHVEIEKLTSTVKLLNRDKLSSDKEKDDLFEEIVFAKKAAEDFENENKALLQKMREMDNQVTSCHEEIEKFKAMERDFSQRFYEMNTEMETLQDRLRSKERAEMKEANELTCSHEKISHLRAELQQLEEGYSKKIQELSASNDALTHKVSELNLRLTEASEKNQRLSHSSKHIDNEYRQTKANLEDEMERIRKELSAIVEEHKMERQEWEDSRAQLEDAKLSCERRLAEAVHKAQSELQEASLREDQLKSALSSASKENELSASKIRDLEDRIEQNTEAFNADRTTTEHMTGSMKSELNKITTEAKETRIKYERERKKTEDLQSNLDHVMSQMEKRDKSLGSMEFEMSKLEDELRKKTSSEAELEFKLSNLTRELKELRERKAELKSTYEQSDQQNHELNKTILDMRTEITVLQSKLTAAEESKQKKLDEVERIRGQMKDFEYMVEDKKGEVSSLSSLVKRYEKNQKDMLKEMAELKEKNSRLLQETSSAAKEKDTVSRELTAIQRTLERKTETNQKAVNDLLDNYRQVEKEKMEIMRTLEDRESELDLLKGRIETTENKRRLAESKADEVTHSIRKMTERLNHYEDSAKRALSFAKAQSTRRQRGENGSSFQDLSKFDVTQINHSNLLDGKSNSLRPSSSYVDVSTAYEDRLVREDSNYNGGDPEKLNIPSSVEITFKILKDRINELEREKIETSTQLVKVRAESENQHISLSAMENHIRSLEKQVHDLDNERMSLESKLASSRQLLLSQEENLRANDNDRKLFKAKMVSADLHSRDKDARLQVLGEQVLVLRTEITRLEKDKQKHKERESQWDMERSHLNHQLNSLVTQIDELTSDCNKLTKKKESLTEKLHETQTSNTVHRERCADLERTLKTHKESLFRMQNTEDQYKTKLDGLKRSVHDVAQVEKRLETMRMEMDAVNSRYKTTEHEREQLRRELMDIKSKYSFSQQKINDLQKIINELTAEKKRAMDRLDHLERHERDSASLEKDLRHELDGLRSERLSLNAELEDSKRKIQKLYVEKREIEAQRSRLDRERAALKTHIQALDLDKQRIESSIRQTVAERQALDKSLNAMEKENTELYRNCSLLQSQVAQLERDSTNKVVENQAKKKLQLEGDLSRINQEKRQLEKVLEQREQNYAHKTRMFEAQISNLRDQLDVERRRLRDQIAERTKSSTQSLPGPAESRREISIRRTHSRTVTSSSPIPKAPFRI